MKNLKRYLISQQMEQFYMHKIKLYNYFLIGILLLSHFGCKEKAVSEPEVKNSSISGSVLFLDGTKGVSANLELQNVSNDSRTYTIADQNGNYEFTNLISGDYFIRFKSGSYNISGFEKGITLLENDNFNQDVFILYNMVDELKAIEKNKDVVLIKFQQDGAKIGTNYNSIDYLSGIYSKDISNSYTLSCDIYICPDTLNWLADDSYFNIDYIKQNFEFVTSVDESLINGKHEIRFYENDIASILSNPTNGFIFVKKTIDDTKLKVPCVDFNNNDFGLKIRYK